MIVSFPFTFSFSVPGLPNPFSSTYSSSSLQPASLPPGELGNSEPGPVIEEESSMGDRLASSPTPSFSSSSSRPTKSLKRGWEPAFAETTTQSTTTLVSTRGYLDPPLKHTAEIVNVPSMYEEGALHALQSPCSPHVLVELVPLNPSAG
ncbi:hypothetical protein D9756_008463 [Leucocoprinus leucothites]|uniref:Uncharacterized protein n=1 Tax=Leucocoprinus leucothites TaxID=201217 RepID=A0A8H5D1Y7_9AGAR|nr:hypothetical protein D9756_008463 [Leucoagaricus leucothites]